jgi:hypothetical protein
MRNNPAKWPALAIRENPEHADHQTLGASFIAGELVNPAGALQHAGWLHSCYAEIADHGAAAQERSPIRAGHSLSRVRLENPMLITRNGSRLVACVLQRVSRSTAAAFDYRPSTIHPGTPPDCLISGTLRRSRVTRRPGSGKLDGREIKRS